MVQASMRHCGRSARSIGSERGLSPDSPRRLVAVIKPMSAAFRGIQVVPRYFIALKPFGFRALVFSIKGVSLWNAGRVVSLRGVSTGAYLI